MKTFASHRPRVAIALLATLLIVGACGSEPSDDTSDPGTSDSGTSDSGSSDSPSAEPGETPQAPPGDQATPGDPGARPDDPDEDGRIMPPDGPGVEVVWIEDSLYVVAPGSSSCPPRAHSVEVVSDTEWIIDVTPRIAKNIACTMDLVPHRSRIGAPEGADPEADVMVTVVDGDQRSEPVPVTVLDVTSQ